MMKDFSMRLGMSYFCSLIRGMGKDTSRLHVDGDACKGNTDISEEKKFRTGSILKLGNGHSQNRPDREE